MSTIHKRGRPSFLRNLATTFIGSPSKDKGDDNAKVTSPTSSEGSGSSDSRSDSLSPLAGTWSGTEPLTSGLSSSGNSSDDRETPIATPHASPYITLKANDKKGPARSPSAEAASEEIEDFSLDIDGDGLIVESDIGHCKFNLDKQINTLADKLSRPAAVRKNSASSHFSNLSNRTAKQTEGSDADDDDKEEQVARWPRPGHTDRSISQRLRSNSLKSILKSKTRPALSTSKASISVISGVGSHKASGEMAPDSDPDIYHQGRRLVFSETLDLSGIPGFRQQSHHASPPPTIGVGQKKVLPVAQSLLMPSRPRIIPSDAVGFSSLRGTSDLNPSAERIEPGSVPMEADLSDPLGIIAPRPQKPIIDYLPSLLSVISPLELPESILSSRTSNGSKIKFYEAISTGKGSGVPNESPDGEDTVIIDRALRRAKSLHHTPKGSRSGSPTTNMTRMQVPEPNCDSGVNFVGSYKEIFEFRMAAQTPATVMASPGFLAAPSFSVPGYRKDVPESPELFESIQKEKDILRRSLSNPNCRLKLNTTWFADEAARGPIMFLESPPRQCPVALPEVVDKEDAVEEEPQVNPYFAAAHAGSP